MPQKMSEAEIWAAVGGCPHATKLILSGWTGVSEKSLRSMAISLGEHLELIDLSDTLVTNEMVRPRAHFAG